MSIGLFVDVDDVLTQEPINIQLARFLGVEKELLDIENDYNNNQINNDQFNNVLIPLFQSKKLTQSFIIDNFNNFRMKIYYEDILNSCENVYLLSSGPSYFIDILAKKMSIPQDRVLCSKYKFDHQGIIYTCSYPVNSFMKADFVKRNAETYDLTIGIGNNPEQDSAFLSNCDIKILMDEFRDGYISVRDFGTLIHLIQALKCVERLNPTEEVVDPTREITKAKSGYSDLHR